MLYLFYAALIAWVGSELWINLRDPDRNETDQDRNSRKSLVLTVALAIVYGGLIVPHLPHIRLIPKRMTMLEIGTLVMIAGILMRIGAVLTLGRFFRTTIIVQEGHKVIQHGLYKLIRHPSYAAILVTVTGLGLATDNLVALIGMDLIMLVGLLHRIGIEEQVLSTQLGEEYRSYMKHTKRIIPYLY